MANSSDTILTVENMSVQFPTLSGVTTAVRDVSFTVGREKIGIIGESGSGKSTTGRAIMRLQPPQAIVKANRMQFENVDLLTASEAEMRSIRGRRIAMILQDPKYSLNPVMTVGEQISETVILHGNATSQEARSRTLAMLERVNIRDPERVFGLYPHEVSGGMGQRIMISMMLIAQPSLIIADEPTSALDVTVRQQVLSILDDLVVERNIGLIFISHDLNLVRSFCDRVIIMYAGRVVETIAAANLDQAQHPYTRGLLNALPSLDHPRDRLEVLRRDPAWLEN
ncbi:ABC transporter ATP-binding protein [Agrobacterium pusense]|jgi:peptide/nickel transport system ATP-binding protein|uniref:ABC transporter ATP-binding protein n=1 Tax=Agrobacterium pusense TaxID=648995 RepID=UPI000C2D3F63|nr:ABC transporter ATP-binding protein [Agrobacterium pusense]AUC13241.1 peptide ABC transporter ATP-binding protein [Rhizobium sp. Y9]MBB2908652.1 peptide/nickel transport system ATP-binding protein [Rhizobium sp. RAS22]MDP9773630.1 peptide/nickel transport system ATP-binding protein [Rhizobium sp. SORGH_AS_0755]MBP2614851.1 peptide/nickel transport system ATP-binding protein [Agrobacterium pusense]UXT92806.1 ABC transporter ATP-binding protein [Agrobacterium pusense]